MVIEPGGHVIDGVSAVVVLGALAKILPPLAALLSIIWYGIRLYDYFKTRNTKD